MEVLVSFTTSNAEDLIKKLFGENKHREVLLDRAKLRYEKSSVLLEGYGNKVDITVSMLTPFGAAPLSSYFQKKLSNGIVSHIKIGGKTHTVLNDGIRQELLFEYMKTKN